MATIRALELDKHIERGGLRPVYVLAGSDESLLSMCISTLKAAVERPELPGSIIADLEEPKGADEVFDPLHTSPFMGMKGVRLVIVRQGEQFARKNAALLTEYAARPSPTGTLALCCGEFPLKKEIRSKKKSDPESAKEEKSEPKSAKEKKTDPLEESQKVVARKGVLVNCAPLAWREAEGWIRAQAQSEGKTLTPMAASSLLDAVGLNVIALRGELDKLVLYVGEERTITERDVEEIVPETRSRSIFELADAIAEGDATKALRLGEELLLRGERLESIIGFVSRQVRTLWQVRQMVKAGSSQQEIGRALRMRDFAVRKAVEAAKALPPDWLARQIKLLAAADEALKTTSIQAREEAVWLNALLARLCQQRPAGGRKASAHSNL